MAAVMLAGAPLCNEAFAAAVITEAAPAADLALANGVKFIIKSGSVFVATTPVKVTAAEATYATTTTATTVDNAAVFEVVNFQKNALGATFELKVDGKHFALTAGASAVTTTTAKNKVFTTFTATPNASGKYIVKTSDLMVVESATTKSTVAAANNLFSKEVKYDDVALNEFNANSTTFSFGEGVEGNIFNGLTPITIGTNTYFVSGKADDVNDFKSAFATAAGLFTDAIKAAAKKLSFAAVTNEKWGLNTSVEGEGYKLAMVNGAAFYGDKKLAADNILFTSIIEADQLNNEGEVELAISPKFEGVTGTTDVTIKSVKASVSDPKTYVTTVASTTTTGTTVSKYAKVSNPTLGDNTYFAASEFLKAGEVSAFNIYATSAKDAAAGADGSEYHKYYVTAPNATYSDFASSFKAQQDVDLTNPAAQWIATGFDGKYTLTLRNRLNPSETLSLRLAASDNAGEYDVVSGDLATKTIKLLPATLTKYDGSLELSEEQIKEGVTLSFSGKNAAIGEQTFFLTDNATATTPATQLVPTLEGTKAVKLDVTRARNDKKEDYVLGITQYAYLDAAGAVVANDVAKADTLVVPAYQFAYGDKKVAGKFELGTTADYYLINKTMDGSYTVTYSTAAPTYATHTHADNNAVGVAATVTGSTVIANFALPTKYFAPAETGFASLAVDANDNYDYASLPAVSRHATFENALGAVSFQENKNGILEGIMSAEPATFWLDTADSETNVQTFYISKGIKAAEETKAYSDEVRNFLYYASDSLKYFDEASATIKYNPAYILEGTTNTLKAIFHPAALVAEDTMTTVFDGKEVAVVAEKPKAGQVAALKNFQFGIRLADENVADEYVIYSKKDASSYLYALNGKLGFTSDKNQALVVKLGEGDATANEAIAAENNVAVIAGEGVVTVKGAAGKQVVVSNILGQVIANKVATSDEETIAVAAGVAVVVVDGEATKVVVK